MRTWVFSSSLALAIALSRPVDALPQDRFDTPTPSAPPVAAVVRPRPSVEHPLQRSLLSAPVVAAVVRPRPSAENPFELPASPVPRNRIDDLLFAQWQRSGIEPARPCSDAVFIRRAYLDVIGTLPTARETSAFLLDGDPEKRGRLIDRLLERDEYADYWAMKWGDRLRVKAEFPINLWPNAVQAYHRWIRTALAENVSYDRFTRELLTASGSNFRVPPVNFYRAVQSQEPRAIAQAVALTFMGTRTGNWPEERLDGMAMFFSRIGFKATGEWKEEIVHFAPGDAPQTAIFPDGTSIRLLPGQDPRALFADWLIRPENPWFKRNIVNRVWSWLLGRGIIHEPDDIRPDNPPVNGELLAWLEQELVTAGYDLKQLYRVILNSSTYQLSAMPRTRHPDGPAMFAVYPLRRLEAEVLIDALCQITGTTEKYSSPIPEPFTHIPERQRSIALADGSITSSFLELFGRPPRDTGLESERSNLTTAAQRLHLLNSSHIQRKLEQGPNLRALIQSGRNPRDIVVQLYLTILSRHPTEEELTIARDYAQDRSGVPREAALDLAWALINTPEFLYRH